MEHRDAETAAAGKRMRCFELEMTQLKSWFRHGHLTWESPTCGESGGTDEQRRGSVVE